MSVPYLNQISISVLLPFMTILMKMYNFGNTLYFTLVKVSIESYVILS